MITVKNEKEFIEQYDKFYDKIFNFILRSVLSREKAEDLTANTFLKALRYIKTKNKEIKKFSAWMYRIATNMLIDSHKQYKKNKKVSIDDENNKLNNLSKSYNGNSIEKYADFCLVRDALKELNPEERMIIELLYYENKNYSEISKILKIKETTLRSKIHRTLKKLKPHLTDIMG